MRKKSNKNWLKKRLRIENCLWESDFICGWAHAKTLDEKEEEILKMFADFKKDTPNDSLGLDDFRKLVSMYWDSIGGEKGYKELCESEQSPLVRVKMSKCC